MQTLWNADDDDLGGVTGRGRTHDTCILRRFTSWVVKLNSPSSMSTKTGLYPICQMIVRHFLTTHWGMSSPVQKSANGGSAS
jgi:hypothetical protein